MVSQTLSLNVFAIGICVAFRVKDRDSKNSYSILKKRLLSMIPSYQRLSHSTHWKNNSYCLEICLAAYKNVRPILHVCVCLFIPKSKRRSSVGVKWTRKAKGKGKKAKNQQNKTSVQAVSLRGKHVFFVCEICRYFRYIQSRSTSE